MIAHISQVLLNWNERSHGKYRRWNLDSVQYGEANLSLTQKYGFTKKNPQFLLNQYETNAVVR